MMTQLRNPADPFPACLALQSHYELVGDRVVGDLYYSSDLYDDAWAKRLVDGLMRTAESIGAVR